MKEKKSKKLFAEWEEQSFIQFAMPYKNSDWKDNYKNAIKIVSKIINIITSYQKVLLIYKNSSSLKYINKNKNLIIKKIKINDIWCRDYGAISYKNLKTSEIELYNFQFNGWGLKYASNFDNQVTKKIGFKNKIIDKNMILEGGSFDFNGVDTLITTETCLLENNRNITMSKNKIDKKLKKLFGLKKVIWLKNGAIKGDDTDSHIDMLARFVNKNTIVYQTPNIAMEKELQNLKKDGFKIIPLPKIKSIYDFYDKDKNKKRKLPASYVNFLITNKAVILPIYNDKNSDKKVIKIFQKLFKDRKIIPINATELIKQNGSIHCISMNYAKEVNLQ